MRPEKGQKKDNKKSPLAQRLEGYELEGQQRGDHGEFDGGVPFIAARHQSRQRAILLAVLAGYFLGGSYDYLFAKDARDMINEEDNLERMAERLMGLGYANDAAHETLALLLTIRQYRIYTQSIIQRLSTIWQNVEWWDSGDGGEEGVKLALALYREPFTPKEKK